MRTSEKSRRQVNRERTHRAIHRAALELVQAKGLKATTTDEIAAAAGVSPRTLFNYFAGKEDAVLGLRAPAVTQGILQRDAERDQLDFFERMVHFALDIIVSSVDGPTYEQVREQIERYPELRYRMRLHNLECETTLRDFLLTLDWPLFKSRGRRGPFPLLPGGSGQPAEALDRARATVNITTALLRHIDFVRGEVLVGEERDARVRQTVATFRYLLRED